MPDNRDAASKGAGSEPSRAEMLSKIELLEQELSRERGLLVSEREAAFRRQLVQAENIGALSNQLRGAKGMALNLEAETAELRAGLESTHAMLRDRNAELVELAQKQSEAAQHARAVAAQEVASLTEKLAEAENQARVFKAQERSARLGKQSMLDLELSQLQARLAWLEREAGPSRLYELREQHVRILGSLRRPEPLNVRPAELLPNENDAYFVIARSSLFDRTWYAKNYSASVAGAQDAVLHYLRSGWREGCDPGPAFQSDSYLIANPDVAAAGLNPLLHYLEFGRFEENRRTGAIAGASFARSAELPKALAPSRTARQQWFFAGDTLDWLQHHAHLTGVGRVTSELLVAAVTSEDWCASPCRIGRSLSGLVGFDAPEDLRELARRMSLGTAAIARFARRGIGPKAGPRAGDHVVFTGVVWTESYERLFRHLNRIGVSFSVLIHDIIPVRQAELIGTAYSLEFERWLATVLRLAETIYVSTPQTAWQVRRWSVASRVAGTAKIRVIPFGIRLLAIDTPTEHMAATHDVAGRDYVLSVGTIDRRKNQIILLRVWQALLDKVGSEKLPMLILIGRDDLLLASDDEFAALIEAGRLMVLTDVTDEQLAMLYRGCLFTAFPSLCEGYGLPVAESLAFGKLCVSADLAEVRAHAGDLAWYFDPHAFDDAMATFSRAILDTAARNAASAAIAARYEAMSWGRSWDIMQEGGSPDELRTALGPASTAQFAGTVTLPSRNIMETAERWCVEDEPSVSILIINWNSAPLTLDCIRQVWSHTTEVRYEIIIADNGSAEDQRQTLRELGPGVRFIELGCNRYFGEANNIAAQEARGKFICFLNNDAFVQTGWLSALVAPFAADTSVGATGPLFIYPNGTVQEAGASVNQFGYPVRFARNQSVVPPEINRRRLVDYISAAALVVERTLFMTVGGFDLAFEPAYYEDTDLCFKLAAQGRRVLFCPDVKVIHIEGSSANGDVLEEQRRTRLGDLNRAKFVSRWGRYLRDRDEATLAELGGAVVPDEMHATVPLVPGRPRALVFTPYNLTPGGGERYLLTLATTLSRTHDVIFATPFPYSRLRLYSIGAEFSLDVTRLHLRHSHQIDQEGPFDVQVTMGNQIWPDCDGKAALNIYHCQFPFPQARSPSEDEVARLSTYDAILVNSNYTALHTQAALYANQLADRPIHVLHPPVDLLTPGVKRPDMILSVGRFFTGGHTKRQDMLIAAFKRLCEQFDAPLELHLAGSSTPNNDSMQYLTDLIATAEGYPIHFHVNCPSRALRDLYASAAIYWHGTGIDSDLVANPSAAEHFGIAIVEAMSAGAVPFALASGGIREVIRSGENGFLYRNQEDLIGQTLALLRADPRYRARVRDNAILRARDFSTEVFVERFLLLLDQLRNQPPGNDLATDTQALRLSGLPRTQIDERSVPKILMPG